QAAVASRGDISDDSAYKARRVLWEEIVMPVNIRPLHPTIGAEVTGVDLRKPLTKDEVAAIEAGMDKHAVLVFPNQDITDEQQTAFTLNFGQLEDTTGGHVLKHHEKRLARHFADVS